MNQKIEVGKIERPVQIWLVIGLVMVFFQIVIGGVTRLTDSGLSITDWAVIQGTLPPIGLEAWQEAFDLYKVHAKKQFESLHADMTLQEFKFIYFWEYFHRLWARLMGFVFIIPFILFWRKGWMPSWLRKRLGIVILLAIAAAVFGWIMVASGLNDDKRTWVSAYKLITHLGIATALFVYLFWTWLKSYQPKPVMSNQQLYRSGWWIAGLLMIQILFGGLMAGMRAGLIHPHWPFFIQGSKLMHALSAIGQDAGSMIDYEASLGVKGVVQILHRLTAYLLAAAIIWFYTRLKGIEQKEVRIGKYLLISMLIIQFILGILTIVYAVGGIPIGFGALHQCVALLLFASLLYLIYQFKEVIHKEVNN